MNTIAAITRVIFILLVILTVPTIHIPAGAVETGGEIQVQSGLFYKDELSVNFLGEGELEFFLPGARNLDTRLVLRGRLEQSNPELGIKYLYLRRRHENGHITLGRQPVSWSYGAIFNPLDYGLGVEGLAGITHTPEMDGIRFFRFLGAGSGFQVVTGFDQGLTGQSPEKLGYGGRLRVPLPGHDISLNISYRPFPATGEDNLLRGGLTYSGDAGPVGIYGALGYYRLHKAGKDDYVVQLGIDYSKPVGPEYDRRLFYLQVEYMIFVKEQLSPTFLWRYSLPAEENSLGSHDLLAVNIFLEIDPFSQLGTALIAETTGGRTLTVTPYFQSDLGGGVELRIEGVFLFHDIDGTGAAVNAGLSYCF